TEYLHDSVGAYTLFATHHHELTEIVEGLPRARNYHFSAERSDDGVEFEHDLRTGPAGASYGIEVAEMAGVPANVVDRAEALLTGETRPTAPSHRPSRPRTDPASTDGGREALLAELAAIDLAETTPLEALNLLSKLQSELE
ncbi:MAG: DNA mismatch repair protein MutS, partial [Haloplanus sp.]